MSTDTKTTGELVTAPAQGGADLVRLMEIAVTQGEGGVAALERLVALQERAQAKAAQAAHAAAMAAFQAACPPVVRAKGIPDASGNIKYHYAPLEDIVAAAGPHLRAAGLSYSFAVTYPDGATEVACIITHAMGHDERSSVRMPGVQVPKANAAQNSGAAVTYGKRLAFLNATGIVTADEDSDAADYAQSVTPITEDQLLTLRSLLDELDFSDAQHGALLEWLKVEALVELPSDRYKRAVAFLESKRGAAQ